MRRRGKKPRHTTTPARSAWNNHARPDDGTAFLPDDTEHPLPEDDAESMAEEFIASATTGESVVEDARDEVVPEEQGGPFIELDERANVPLLADSDEEVPPSAQRAKKKGSTRSRAGGRPVKKRARPALRPDRGKVAAKRKRARLTARAATAKTRTPRQAPGRSRRVTTAAKRPLKRRLKGKAKGKGEKRERTAANK